MSDSGLPKPIHADKEHDYSEDDVTHELWGNLRKVPFHLGRRKTARPEYAEILSDNYEAEKFPIFWCEC